MQISETITPQVLVVIVNYNQGRLLNGLLQSVLASEYSNFKVVLVDNGSVDNSLNILAKFNDPRLVKLPIFTNLGLCKGRNFGANYADSRYFVFLDPDVIVTPTWLERLVDKMESDSTIGIAESNIVSKVSWAASSPEKSKLYALGAAFIVRNNVWKQLGGFDDDYFIGYEDQDIGWRTWLLGHKVVGVADSTVFHFPGSLRKGSINKIFRYHSLKNELSSMIKNLEWLTLCKQFPRILYFTGSYCFEDFKNHNTEGLFAVFWVVKNMGRLLQKRIVIQKTRKLKDKDVDPLWNPSVRGSFRRSGRYLRGQ
jgi:GT2 family glycosyltransferase